MQADDGVEVHYQYWAPTASPRALVQIVHGAAEHGERYDRFAGFLVDNGYAVYATDHRGHGRTRLRSGALGDAGPDAWNRMVTDEIQLSRLIGQDHPGKPLILFGHSLGSFIAQDYITRQGGQLDGLVLSGTAYGPPPPQELLDVLEAAVAQAPLADSAVWADHFAGFNKPFSEQPGFDWLSRDKAEVQKYLDDPLCGFAFSNELVRDFFKGMADLRDPAREAAIPRDLPILVIQGEMDPVGGNLKETQALLDRFRELGVEKVQHRFYPGARHEMLNETNRDEVQGDVLDWLNALTAA